MRGAINHLRYLHRSKHRQHEIDEVKECVANTIKRSRETNIVEFNEVYSYVKNRFSTVQFEQVPIYIVPNKVMDRYAWKGIGGCFVRSLSIVLLKDEIEDPRISKSKLTREIYKDIPVKITRDDILVHEMMHVISFLIGRSSSNFKNMEEEFAYTNCIDFYLIRGMSIEDVINNVYLPFFLTDIINDVNEMSIICNAVQESWDKIRYLPAKEYEKWLNNNADILSPIFMDKIKNMSQQMVDSYNKYGKHMIKTSNLEVSNIKSRLQTIDLDVD